MNQEVTVNRVEHVRVVASRAYADVVRDLRARTGLFDFENVKRRITAGAPAGEISDLITSMEGSSGFMRLGEWDHGAVLRQTGQPTEAIRFAIGHPLIAARMTRHQISAGLYAPLSVLVAGTETGGAALEYDRPSSLFQLCNDADVMAVARELDFKLDSLVRSVAIGGE